MDKAFPIVILTGAGISAESGIQTFRAQDGLWEEHRIEDVATPEAFSRDPALVHRFYNMRRRSLQDEAVRPNAAHFALAALEQVWPSDVLIVTQNVDNLHERAGSTQIIHMHGALSQVLCQACDGVFDWHEDVVVDTPCPACGVVQQLRPNIVWFGEMPYEMERIETALAKCGLFISIGTSGHVYPAAGFVQRAHLAGAETVELNREPSRVHTQFKHMRLGMATEVVPQFVNELLADNKKGKQ